MIVDDCPAYQKQNNIGESDIFYQISHGQYAHSNHLSAILINSAQK